MGGFLFFGFVMRAVVLVLFLAALAYAQQGRGSDYTLSFFGSENCNIETLIVQQVFDLSECTNFRYNNLHDGCGQSLQCLFVDVDDEDYSDNLECPRQFPVTPRTIIPDYGVVVEYIQLDVLPTPQVKLENFSLDNAFHHQTTLAAS